MQVLIGRIGSPVCGMLVAGGFCYGRLLDESFIARESQNSPDSYAGLRPAPQHLFLRETRHRVVFAWPTSVGWCSPGPPGLTHPTRASDRLLSIGRLEACVR